MKSPLAADFLFCLVLVSPSSRSDALNEGKEWHFAVVLMPPIGGKVPLESGLGAIRAGTKCRPRYRLRTPKRLFAPTQTIVRLGANGNGQPNFENFSTAMGCK